MPTILITTQGAGNVTIPAHTGNVLVECWGAGGNGGTSVNNGGTEGGTGGGGASPS